MAEEAVAASTPLAFETVYEQYADRIYRFCLLQVGNHALAEDLAEDTFVSAFRAYSRTAPDPDRVHIWLFRIARNLISNHRRNERTRGLVHQLLGRDLHSKEIDVETVAAANAEIGRVIRLMSKMKERDRRALSLHIASDLTIREVAEVLEVPLNTAGSIVRRALDRFHRLDERTP